MSIEKQMRSVLKCHRCEFEVSFWDTGVISTEYGFDYKCINCNDYTTSDIIEKESVINYIDVEGIEFAIDAIDVYCNNESSEIFEKIYYDFHNAINGYMKCVLSDWKDNNFSIYADDNKNFKSCFGKTNDEWYIVVMDKNKRELRYYFDMCIVTGISKGHESVLREKNIKNALMRYNQIKDWDFVEFVIKGQYGNHIIEFIYNNMEDMKVKCSKVV
jgi:hypothetical protein